MTDDLSVWKYWTVHLAEWETAIVKREECALKPDATIYLNRVQRDLPRHLGKPTFYLDLRLLRLANPWNLDGAAEFELYVDELVELAQIVEFMCKDYRVSAADVIEPIGEGE